MRNSRVVDLYNEFFKINKYVEVYDPHADKTEVKKKYGIKLIKSIEKEYDIVILAVAHIEFKNLNFERILKKKRILYLMV